MLNILLVIVQIFIIYSVYKLFFSKLEFTEGLGVSFLIFNGFISFLLFIIGWMGVPITKNTFVFITSFFLLASISGLYLKHESFKTAILQFGNIWQEMKKNTLLEKILAIILVLLVILILLINNYWPFWLWDVLTLYEFRADLIFKTGSLSSFLEFGPYYLTHPLFTTMTHVWLYLTGFQNVKFIYALYYAIFGVLFYNLLRKNISRKLSLFFTFLMLITGDLISAVDASYSNLPYMIFFTLGALYLYNYFKKIRTEYLIISSLFLAFSVWSRALEPYWVVCLISLLFFLYSSHSKVKNRTLAIFLLPIMAVYVSWNVFSRTAGGGNLDINTGYVTSQVAFSGLSKIFAVAAECVSFVYQNFISPNLVLFLSFVFSLIISTKKRFSFYGLWYMIGLILISYAGSFVYYFMVGETNWTQLGDSLFRMSMVTPPLLLYFIAENITDFVNNRLMKE